MKDNKEKLLNETYKKFIQTSLYDIPLEGIHEFIDENIMGYGTAIDEKIFSISDYRSLLIRQREQAKDIKMEFDSTPVFNKISGNGNSALFVEEIVIRMNINNELHQLFLRLSTVLEFRDEKWIVLHWHGSKPDNADGETDTWHINEWKQKNAELEKLVEEKTSDLLVKNKELEIESALERVRSRTMAMQKSDELSDVAKELFEQFNLLGKIPDRMSIGIFNEENWEVEIWVTDQGGNRVSHEFFFSLDEHTCITKIYAGWKEGKDIVIVDLAGKNLQDWVQFVKDKAKLHIDEADIKGRRVQQAALFSYGFLLFTTHEPVTDDIIQLLIRFAKVFDQTYTRFLDLKKAEAQARESRIEAALERVRSKAMAMHSSEDLALTVDTFFSELNGLNVTPHRCGVGIVNAETRTVNIHATTATQEKEHKKIVGILKLSGHPVLDSIFENWRLQKEYHPVLHGQEILEYYKIMNPQVTFPDFAGDETQYGYYFFFKEGGVFAWTDKELTERDLEIFRRYTSVLSLTYRRYMDLIDAEAQAREAQIEVALERARTQSMLMQRSEELKRTSQVFHEQLQILGVDSEFSYLWLPEEEKAEHLFWATWQDDRKHSTSYKNRQVTYPLDKTEPSIADCYVAWESGETVHINYVPPTEVEDYFATWTELLHGIEKFNPELFTEGLYYVDAYMKYGCFGIVTRKLLTESEKQILSRFTKEFERAYTRFLDLQKAEAQTREAQIEAALERVRSRTMAMQRSDELRQVVAVVFEEMKSLEFNPSVCAICIFDEVTRESTWWQSDETQSVLPESYSTPRMDHPWYESIYESWQQDIPYFVFELSGVMKKNLDAILFKLTFFKNLPEESKNMMRNSERVVPCYASMSRGLLEVVEEEPLSEEKAALLQRFAKVIDLAYTRFDDLEKAEARARDAVQQASLDRVRADIASMRTTEDLERITPLMWTELTTLGVPFFRCGVFIIDDSEKIVHSYLSTPSGESLGVLHLELGKKTWIDEAVLHWQQRKIYRGEWDRDQFKAWTQTMMDQGFVENREKFQAGQEAPERLFLQLMPFTQGMLYVGSAASLSVGEIELTQKLAEAFGVAYARYEDFQKLEAAKAKVENALDELDLLSKELEVKNVELEAENKRKADELEEARQLQLAMLPKELPQLPHLDIAVHMKTATEVGGDYYDFTISDDGTLNVGIGDGTGHGMQAGTLVTIIKGMFTSEAGRKEILDFFNDTGRTIKEINFGRLMMAFSLLKIKGTRLQYSNAGMPPMYIYRKNSKSVEEVGIYGMPLGAIKDFDYKLFETELNTGDCILLLSDGYPELSNPENEQIGYDRLHTQFADIAEKKPEDIVKYLNNKGSEWVKDKDPDDDVTFVVIKVK